jgi:predicted DNA-binding WGR domain protein
MKPLRRVTLHNTSGTSNKVYEVELLEGDEGGYVVVARWGRIGATLREGTKTDGEVTLAAAQEVYDDLRDKRLGRGYFEHATWEDGGDGEDEEEEAEQDDLDAADPEGDDPEGDDGGDPEPAEPIEAFPPGPDHPRCVRILERLEQGSRAPASARSLSRTVWRAGELMLTEAEPLIRPWVDAQDGALRYSAVWALARFGARASLAALERVVDGGAHPEVLRLVEEARRRILTLPRERVEFVREVRARLPAALGDLPWEPEAIAGAWRELMERGAKARRFLAYADLYLIDDAVARPLVLEFARTAPMKAHEFRAMRWLFKAAELRRDAQLFGIIARRFELEREHHVISDWWSSSWGKRFDGTVVTQAPSSWADPKKRHVRGDGFYWKEVTRAELSQEGNTWAYSRATRNYLRRRVWRTLRRMGELADPDFTRMATGVLVAFTDADAQEPFEAVSTRWRYVNGQWGSTNTVRRFGPWAGRRPLSHLLYAHSTRHIKQPRWATFRLAEGELFEEPPFDLDAAREEAFPAVWDAHPVALLHILDESRCHVVHRFAARALHQNAAFRARLDARALRMMLQTPYPEGAEVALGVARSQYDASAPDVELWSWMAASASEQAAAQAAAWLVGASRALCDDAAALARVLGSPHAVAREAGVAAAQAERVGAGVGREVVGRLVSELMGMGEEESEWATGVAQALAGALGAMLSALGDTIVEDLLLSELAACQILAGEALIARNPSRVPDRFLTALFDSEFGLVRAVAGRLLDRLSDTALLAREELLCALVVSSKEDLRAIARPIVGRLVAQDRAFSARLLELLAQVLEVPEQAEGVHASVAALVEEALLERLDVMEPARALDLLAARSVAAQEVGARVLARTARAEDLEVRTLTWVARRDARVAREVGRALIEGAPEHMRAQPEATLQVLDSPWEDARAWAVGWIEGALEGLWTPALCVAVCDMKWPEVEALGRRMVGARIDGGSGPEYLIKLTEHPRASMQEFASGYLERYAGGHPERIEEMGWFFASVLSRVRAGATAKRRALEFLEVEAARSPEGARVAAGILRRAAATIAVRERARAIEILTRIAVTHPEVDAGLEVVEWEDRRGV